MSDSLPKVRRNVFQLDVVLSDCDGWSVLRRLKADSELSEIPVIMVTIVDNEAMGLDLGAAHYLIKPVDRDRLASPDREAPDCAFVDYH